MLRKLALASGVAELFLVRRTDDEYREEADMRRGYWVTFYRSVSNALAESAMRSYVTLSVLVVG